MSAIARKIAINKQVQYEVLTIIYPYVADSHLDRTVIESEFTMKAAVYVLINFLALVTGDEISVSCSVTKGEVRPSAFFVAQKRGLDELCIDQLNVIKEITENNNLTVRYKIADRKDNELSSGVAPFCGADRSTEGGSISKLLMQALSLDEDDCPIAEQEHKTVNSVFSGVLVTDVEVSGRIFILMSLRYNDGIAFAVQYDLAVTPKK